MRTTRISIAMLVGASLTAMAPTASAQDLASRVAAVRDGRVEIAFTPRDGVCGDGRTFIRIGTNSYHGSWNDGVRTRMCDPGPVRVVARVRDGAVDEIRTFVGPAQQYADDVTRLQVAAPEAARWLLDVARRAPGRASAKAIMPAVLADSAVVWRDLLAIARDDARSRETRREATHWLSRFASARVAGLPAGQLELEEDDHVRGGSSDEIETKKAAVFALSQLRNNEGVPQLITVARTNRSPEVRQQALFWIGQSGDPRGLALFEEVLSR